MLIRYVTTATGERKRRAEVYTVDEHGITRDRIDPDALQITRRLAKQGHAAYVVGGAVRDLLIGRTPKDFDVVTDATPARIKKLFRNARVIGKRFRLVHIRFRDKIIEVSTFRSNNDAEMSADRNNVYGKMEEDVHRRDFSMNALYYNPKDQYVIDYVHGFKDVQKKRIRCLIPLEEIFKDDPVRMIRAIKYSAATGFPMDRKMRAQIKRNAAMLADIPVSRLTEELFKILGSRVAATIFDSCEKLDLLQAFLPNISSAAKDTATYATLSSSLEKLDQTWTETANPSKGAQILSATRPLLCQSVSMAQKEGPGAGNVHLLKSELFWESKRILNPLTPPNADIDDSVRIFLREQGYSIEKHRKKHRSQGGQRDSGKRKARPVR